MKKVVTLLLCAVLLVSLLAVSAFAAEPNQFTITADKTEAAAGEEIKFSITLDSTEACDSFGLIMEFDRDLFETVKIACTADLKDEDGVNLIATSAAADTAGKEGFAVSFYDPQVYTGKVGYITLKVKEGAVSGTASVTARMSANNGDNAVATVINTVDVAFLHDHAWVDHAAVEPTCDTEGNIAYQQCSICGAAQTAGPNPMPLGKFGWVLGALGHTWVDHAAVAPTCTSDGNIAYQQCSVCGAAQTAGENPVPLSKFGWVLAAQHTGLVHHDAVAATCTEDGHEEFDYCEDCQVFIYADPLKLSYQDGVIPAGHTWVEYEAVAPTCDTEGNIAYKRCSGCGEAWTLEEEPVALGKDRWVLAALGHTWVDHAAVEPTCDAEGNIAYQQCSVCGTAQTAGENPIPLTKYGWVLGVKHSIKHVEAKAATAEAEGNVEYWYCEDCGSAWLDENMTKVTNLKSVITPKLEAEEKPAEKPEETKPVEKPAEKPEADNDKTADATPVVALIVMAVLAMSGLALVVVNKKQFAA